MREIKFRAWDKITKEIAPVWEIGWKAWRDNEINYVKIELDGTVDRLEHEVELLEYTGLKDKNGKEIYEGDIVRWEYCHPTKADHEIYSGEFQVKIPHIYYSIEAEYTTFSEGKDLEIIGNIYESPKIPK